MKNTVAPGEWFVSTQGDDHWTGHDRQSVRADPRFVDPDGGDFTPRPDFPAFRIGFQPFDVSGAGVRSPEEALKDDPLRGCPGAEAIR